MPTFIPIDPNDITFMGRLLRNINDSLGKGMYLDSLSSWYDFQGNQIFGLRFVHFLHEHLGTTFLQGLDRLIIYNVISQTKQFQRQYGLTVGGGAVSEEHKLKGKLFNEQVKDLLVEFDRGVSTNFQAVNPQIAR